MEVPKSIADFLSQKKILVAGVSSKKSTPAISIARKFAETGYKVSLLHPQKPQFKGFEVYTSINEMPEKPEAVFLFTSPDVTENITDECIKEGIKFIWMHNMLGTCANKAGSLMKESTSVSAGAVSKAQSAGLTVISGSCPMQFLEPLDVFHKCVRWISAKMGNLDENCSKLPGS